MIRITAGTRRLGTRITRFQCAVVQLLEWADPGRSGIALVAYISPQNEYIEI